VREFSVPALSVASPNQNLSDIVVRNATEAPGAVVISRKVGDEWQDVTSRQFRDEVFALAKGLVASGINAGDRIAIMSRTRYEWTLADFAIWCAGAVPVPIYETSSAEQVKWIVGDSEAVAIFLEAPTHAGVVESVHSDLPNLKQVWQFEASDVDKLVAAGSGLDDSEIEQRRGTLTRDSMATLIYTSGTTGNPKGCGLTHGNVLYDVETVVGIAGDLFTAEGSSTLLFLPIAHVFGRLIEIGCLYARARLGHSPDIKNLLPDLAEFQPTFILSVPRVFEKVFNNASQKAHAAGKGKIFDAAAATSIAYSEALEAGSPGLVLKVKHAVFDRLVYSKLRDALGGKAKYAVSGGAPLGARLGHFFRGAGITVFEGYGLTETSAGATLNRPGDIRVGSVGKPIPGAAVRIADDGEVLLKGPHIMRGYWKNETATAEAIDSDGWFHTGDIGELDADGFLRITGRKKELIVTAGGKNVAPALLEDRIRAHYLVSQTIVVGDAQPYIAALVTVDPEAFPAWKEQHGKPANATVAELVDDQDLRAAVQEAIDEGNKAVSKAEAIKRWRILPADLDESTGHLTPTLKLKRNVIAKDFAAEIDALYS
jgi:long-chain acyl-CoA synthetase